MREVAAQLGYIMASVLSGSAITSTAISKTNTAPKGNPKGSKTIEISAILATPVAPEVVMPAYNRAKKYDTMR